MEGPLSKWTNLMNGWQYRWFVLDNSTGLLSYYTSKEKMVRGTRRGCVRLKGAIVGIDNEDDSTFTITDESKTFHFQAHDADEREKWIRALEDAVIHHSATHKKWDLCDDKPSMADFDRRLTESDAYLQILIEQSTNMENLIEKSTDTVQISKIQVILSNLNQIIESVKHCIVLLQIAKNTAFPVYGLFQPIIIADSSTIQNAEPSQINGDIYKSDLFDNVDIQSDKISNIYNLKTGKSALNMIDAGTPDMSYYSSDEDDFVDVDDYVNVSQSRSVSKYFKDAVPINSSVVPGDVDHSQVTDDSQVAVTT